ncbi:MAG: ATP-binding protein [Oscillospiraceae bacterium]|nr:ATP-binding protein [Oscillospiraceae bacterium]
MPHLQETDADRNKLLELIPSGVGIFDVCGGVVRMEYINDGYYQMIRADRKSRGLFTGVGTINAIFDEDRPGLLAEAQSAISEKRLFHYSFRILGGDGVYRWIAIQANHVPLNDTTERFYAAYYDIDELMRAQEKLQANDLAMRDILTYSETTHFIYCPRLHRYESAQLPSKLSEIPRSMDDFPEAFIRLTGMSEEDANSYRAMVRRIDEGEPEADCTVQMSYKNKYSWYRVHMMSFDSGAGSEHRAVGTAVNVDQYAEAQRTFRNEKLRLQSIQAGTLAAMCFNVSQDVSAEADIAADPDAGAVRSHPLYGEALRIEPGIAEQRPATLHILLEAASQIPDAAQRRDFLLHFSHAGMLRLYRQGERTYELTYRRRTAAGMLWVTTRINLLPDPATRDVLAFFYTADVNDRMIYRSVTARAISQGFETVSYYDIPGKKLYVKSFNPSSGIAFHPVDFESAVEKTIEKKVVPEEADEMRRKTCIGDILAALESSDMYTLLYTSTERDATLPGNPFRRIKADAFYLDDKRDILLILQTDVTQVYEQERAGREALERALLAAEKANAAKTEFVSRISHDIRTPIGIISNMTDFARADIDDREKLLHDLDKIAASNTFLLSLINDVLDISKIDSGKIELTPVPYTYEEHHAAIRNVLEPMCEAKGLHCAFERRRKTGTIVADRSRLNQIILNVLSNAVKYTPAGGTVTYISDSEDLPDAKIRFGFEIRDTGIGMSEEFQKHMFEPFSQEYDNPARPQGITGTGLGLSIVKRMVDLMGGTISVHSELGRGTSVRCSIVFPDAARDPAFAGAAGQPDSAAAKPASAPLRGKVLIAEDNEINAEIAVRILTSFGLRTAVAENGLEAVRAFSASAPGEFCAVLMDIQMPVMNGYAATEQIRALPRPDAGVPIIAMTADAFSQAADHARTSGMTAYTTKPLDPAALRGVLEAYAAEDAAERRAES